MVRAGLESGILRHSARAAIPLAAGRSTPSPKCAASARPLVTTEIASADQDYVLVVLM
jgi:hypothetical protein